MKIAENQKNAGNIAAGNLMQQVTTAMANMRRTMNEKHNVEFWRLAVTDPLQR